MRWLFLTLVLLASSACMLGWIYLRDRDTHWRPAESQLVRADVAIALGDLPHGDCAHGCRTEVLSHVGSRWLVRITVKGQSRCIHVNLQAFAPSEHDLSGIQPTRCPTGGEGKTAPEKSS
jgi:hypothetical protein